MPEIKSVCVYCGSASGRDPAYHEAAQAFGAILAAEGIRLIFGGGGVGLMGAVAHSVVKHGGDVTGIIPGFLLAKEGHLKVRHEQIIVDNMHERKWAMYEEADAFVTLPGGIGTLEEVVEMMSWAQLGRHNKPILLANFNGFWNPMLALLDHMRIEGFIRPPYGVSYLVANTVEEILPMLRAARASSPAGGLPLDKF